MTGQTAAHCYPFAVEPGQPVGLVTGLASEATVAAKLYASLGEDSACPPPMIACAGAKPARARKAAMDFLRQGAGALISFGIAGGLEAGLEPGAIILASEVFTPQHHLLPADSRWLGRLLAVEGPKLRVGRIIGSNSLLASTASKARVARFSGGLAVDMESHMVAEVAWEMRRPFLAVRAIIDPLETSLPRIIRGAVDAEGRPRHLLIALRLALTPWNYRRNYRRLKTVERDSRRAHGELAGLAPLAEALFGGPLGF